MSNRNPLPLAIFRFIHALHSHLQNPKMRLISIRMIARLSMAVSVSLRRF